MSSGRVTDKQLAAGPQRGSRLVPRFFACWTVIVGLVVWWFWTRGVHRADFLIALDRTSPGSWGAQARAWMENHLELTWAYPWILLAPYVIWLGLKVPVEKNQLPWRLALHGAVGVGFVFASQALTHRLDASRPRSLVLRSEEVIRRLDPRDTNQPAKVTWTRTLEWRAVVAAVDSNHAPPHPLLPGVLPAPSGGTARPFQSGTPPDKVIVVRSQMDSDSSEPSLWAKPFDGATRTNDQTRVLATRLAPLLEEKIRALEPPGAFGPASKLSTVLDALAYLALLGLTQTIHFRRRLNERETQAAVLESKLTQSRLHALQSQLQPHFLFNTLNGIATLVRRDPAVAEEMLASLSELLRAALTQSGQQEIRLEEELVFLNRYLELQEMRFRDRLQIERHIDAQALHCLVPSLVLQPLAENAIRHAIEPSPEGGSLHIGAERRAGRLILTVEDNGGGLASLRPSHTPGTGIGLQCVRERLLGLYARDHEFIYREKPAGGVVVQICIPERAVTRLASDGGM